MDNYPSGNWVVPFGNLGIKGHLHLPQAYRSLSRPSSPPRAKASTRRPNLLSPYISPLYNKGDIAHTFSCKLRVFILYSVSSLKVFTYSLVCQYVKDLFSLRNPDCVEGRIDCVYPFPHEKVENNGFEPLTPCLQSRCSSQLS